MVNCLWMIFRFSWINLTISLCRERFHHSCLSYRVIFLSNFIFLLPEVLWNVSLCGLVLTSFSSYIYGRSLFSVLFEGCSCWVEYSIYHFLSFCTVTKSPHFSFSIQEICFHPFIYFSVPNLTFFLWLILKCFF